MGIRTLVVDDHEVVRMGLTTLLEGTEVEVVGQAGTPQEAIDSAVALKPQIVLLDIRLGESDGLTVLDELRKKVPESRVVMLSTYDNPTYMARAHALGASDYLLKGCSRQQLILTVCAVARGEVPSPHGELYKVAGTMATKQREIEDGVSLTQRETQVLRHLALGLSNKEIAQSLAISVETVKEHVQHLLRKINVSDRTQAAVWAVKRGLVQ